MTLANRISMFRLLLIPVFVATLSFYDGQAQWPRIAALTIYIIAALSDVVDGYVARRFNQMTRTGQLLDPLADKLLTVIALIFLAVNPYLETHVPLWLPVVLLGRDAVITGGSYLIHKHFGSLDVHPRLLGKLTTILETAAIIAVLLEVPFAPFILYTMVAVVVLSWMDYIVQGITQVNVKSNA